MKNKKTRLIIAVIVGGIIIALRFSPLADYITFQNLKIYNDQLKILVNTNYLTSVMIYIFSYIMVAAFALPVAAIFTIAGGFLFGVIPACIYVDIAATIGAIFAFLASRYLVGEWFQEKYKDKLVNFNKNLQESGANYLLTVRLIFVLPFFLINILAGLTNINLFTFFWTTAVGILPGTAVYAFAGKQIDYIKNPSDIFSFNVMLAFLLLILLSLLPILFKKFKKMKLK